jgi:hypothetical protein
MLVGARLWRRRQGQVVDQTWNLLVFQLNEDS